MQRKNFTNSTSSSFTSHRRRPIWGHCLPFGSIVTSRKMNKTKLKDEIPSRSLLSRNILYSLLHTIPYHYTYSVV